MSFTDKWLLLLCVYICLIAVFYAEIVHIFYEPVLCCQASITQISLFLFPFLQTAIIKLLYIILDDKRDNTVAQTFLEKDKSADSAVTVLKGMYPLKLIMEL